MRITLIAAVANNRVIGKDGQIPWHLPADLAHFKRTTMGHTLVMGRRTYEPAGALPGRRTLVLTRDPDWKPEGAGSGGTGGVPGATEEGGRRGGPGGKQVEVVHSLAQAIERARAQGETELFVCGGEGVYREALPKAHRIELTRVDAEPEGDTRFPEVDWSRWRLVAREEHPPDERHAHAFTFETHERP